MRILLADDHAIVRAGLKRILEDEFRPAVVAEASTADEALQQLAAAPCDVLVLDISMPGRSGLDILPEIRTTHPTTRVIILSSFDDQQFAFRAIRDGALAFLTKERAPRELIDAVRIVMSGRRFISQQLAEQLASAMASGKPERPPHEALSPREFEVFRQISSARTLSEIAVELNLSAKTVSTYRARILEKMGMSTNAELMRYAIRHNLVI